MQYGYVRVSSKEQNIDRQMTAMKEQGIAKEKIFIDKATGNRWTHTWNKLPKKGEGYGYHVYGEGNDEGRGLYEDCQRQ